MHQISIYTNFLKILLIFFLLPLYGTPDLWETENEEEALFLRRIADFWQEGEYQIVKGQIEEFLQVYPNSSFYQTLCATMGDLYLREKNFKEALLYYSRIQDFAIFERVFFNRMQCLLELQWFATLADECEQLLSLSDLLPEKKIQGTYLLSVALYQQILNASPESEELAFLIQRASPHFEFLLSTEFASEIGPAYAHVCCLNKNFSSASEIYVRLAEQSDQREDLLFQAALLQAKVDRTVALNMFQEIEETGSSRSEDALYNRIVLLADMGAYQQLVDEKEAMLKKVSSTHRETARVFFGHAHLQLKQDLKAIEELSPYIENHSNPSETLRSAYLDFFEATYNLGEKELLQKALNNFESLFPKDSRFGKGVLALAVLLKNQSLFDEAEKKLEFLLSNPDLNSNPDHVLFELLQVKFLQHSWKECATHCRTYLKLYPTSPQISFVARFLVHASSQLALLKIESFQEDLLCDLRTLLTNELLPEKDRTEWRFLLAKELYEVKEYRKSCDLLEAYFLNESSPYQADAHLLLGLCYRDGEHDLFRFCKEANQALSLGVELLERGTIHIALFNAYLELDDLAQAAEHLYLASKTKELQGDHLRWLSDFYYEESVRLENTELSLKAIEIMEKFLAQSNLSVHCFNESLLSNELFFLKLAELYSWVGNPIQEREILESLKKQRSEHPEWAWNYTDKTDLLLGECYLQLHLEAEAFSLFESIRNRSSSIRNFAAASACLHSARIQLDRWKKEQHKSLPIQVLTQLKNLVLQRTLSNEPIHLEAALEYIDLQTALEKNSTEKRLSLLKKTKEDFSLGEDLLSRDYQQSRSHFPKQNRIYSDYMNLFSAEILFCKAELTSNASEKSSLQKEGLFLLKKLLESPINSFLKKRIERHLKFVQANEA